MPMRRAGVDQPVRPHARQRRAALDDVRQDVAENAAVDALEGRPRRRQRLAHDGRQLLDSERCNVLDVEAGEVFARAQVVDGNAQRMLSAGGILDPEALVMTAVAVGDDRLQSASIALTEYGHGRAVAV